MKKLIILALLMGSLIISNVSADDADHSRILPDFSNIKFDVNNVYAGVELPIAFPVGFIGPEKIAGFGAGFTLEAGYDWDGWLLGLHTEFRGNADNGNAFKSLKNTFITLDASKLLDKSILPFLPDFLDLRASAGFGIDVISGTYYPNEAYKKNNEFVKASKGVMAFNFGVEAEYNQIEKFIPYAGLDFSFSGDKKGLFTHAALNIGVRSTFNKITGPHNGNPALSIRTSPSTFTPDGDGTDDEVTFKITPKYQKDAQPKSWKVEVFEEIGGKDSLVKTYSGEGLPPKTLVWNAESDKKQFIPTSASDYKVCVTVTDSLGNTNTQEVSFGIGILVEKLDDGSLRILVNSIKFDADKATFDTLSKKEQAANNATIKMIAKALKKYKQYNVIIEGHAHNVSGTEKEETEELLPLSQERANVIMNILVEEGVPASSLTAVGKGGKEPISTESAKNRRVEFKLVKKLF